MPKLYVAYRKGRLLFLDAAPASVITTVPGTSLTVPSTDLSSVHAHVWSGRPGLGTISQKIFDGLGSTTAPPTAELTNDGDKFALQVKAFVGIGTVSGYRVYSMRPESRYARYLQAEMDTPGTMYDDQVYDGVTVRYKTYAIVNGLEVLTQETSGTQPARPWDGPITITQNGTYTGNYRSLDPNVDAVTVANNLTAVFLTGGRIASKRHGITAGNSKVVVSSRRMWGLHPGVDNSAQGFAFNGAQCTSVTFVHNYTEGWRFQGYINGQVGGAASALLTYLSVLDNISRNIEGRRTVGTTGYAYDTKDGNGNNTDRAFPVGHWWQLNGCKSVANGEIGFNRVTQEPWVGFLEDVLNLFKSSGTSSNRIWIHHNLIYGGYATLVATGGYAGCGIICDGAPANLAEAAIIGWLLIEFNTIIGTTNAGIGIAHGSNNIVQNNRCMAASVLEDGTPIWGNNIGIYLDEQEYSKNHFTGSFTNNVVQNNQGSWWCAPNIQRDATHGASAEGNYQFYFPANGVEGNVATGNTSLGAVAQGTEYAENRSWLAAMRLMGRIAGPLKPTQGFWSLVNDDSYATAYDRLRPAFNARGFKYVEACITSRLNTGGSLTTAQVQTLTAEGHTPASHTNTHVSVNTLSETDLRNELQTSKDVLTTMTGRRIRAIVYPNGGRDDTSDAIVSQYFSLGVAVDGATNSLPVANRMGVHRVSIGKYFDYEGTIAGVKYYNPTRSDKPANAKTTDSLDYYKARVLEAYTNGYWLVFMTHAYEADYAPGTTQWTNLIAVLDYLLTLPIRNVTLEDMLVA